MLRRIFTLFSLCSLLATAADFSDVLLASVGDKTFTLADVRKITARQESQLAQQLQGKNLELTIQQLRKNALEIMISQELAYMEFQDLKGIIPPEVVQQRINSAVLERAGGKLSQFEELLEQEDMTMDEYREKIKKDLAIEILVHDRTQRGNIISEHEIDEYYQKRGQTLAKQEKFHLAVIQLRDNGRFAGKIEATRQEIIAKLKNGTPFAELAKEYSEGAGAQNGGDQGWMRDPHEKLLAALKTLAPGQTNLNFVDIGSSHYLVHLIEHETGGVPPMTKELRAQIRTTLEKEASDKRMNDFIRQLYMKYPVKRFDGTPSPN